MAKLRKNNEYAIKINFASVAMLAMLSGQENAKKKRSIVNKKIGVTSPMKAQKEVVRYGWHDCLNGLSGRGRREKPSPLGAGNDT